jgi:hypothetical protein
MCTGFFYDLNIYMENQEQHLGIADLAVIKNIIDLACSRGAFRATEMRAVGEVYDKLSGFLQMVVQQAEAKAEAEQQGETK